MLVSVPNVLGLQIVVFMSHVERVFHSHYHKHSIGNCLCMSVCVISNHMTNNMSASPPDVECVTTYMSVVLHIYRVMHSQRMVLVVVGISTHSIVWLFVCELLLFECSRGQVIYDMRDDQRDRASERGGEAITQILSSKTAWMFEVAKLLGVCR